MAFSRAKALALAATALLVALLPARTYAQSLSYLVDLSGGTLSNSRFANGSVSEVSPDSFTLVGSDGVSYYPNTTSTYTVPGVLSAAGSFATANPLDDPAYFVGTPALTPFTPVALQYSQTFAPFLLALDPDLRSHLSAGNVVNFVFNAYQIAYSFDYSFAVADAPGFDVASGTILPTAAGPAGGHVEAVLFNFGGTPSPVARSGQLDDFPISWSVLSLDNLGGAGTLTVSNLLITATPMSFVIAVPEPAAILLGPIGVLVLLALNRRRSAVGPLRA